MQGVYGWFALESKKFHRAPNSGGNGRADDYYMSNQGEFGDVIGVNLSFDKGSGMGTLSFYKNGQDLGPAFDNIPPGTYYPLLSMQCHTH